MLTLTRKKYEIEEPIVLNDENGNTIYEFIMQLTSDEVQEIKELIFDKNDAKNGRKLAKLEETSDEYEKLEAKVLEDAERREKRMEEICFKEHRIPFKEKAGQYKYNEMLEMIFDFFVQTFADKKAKQLNTMNSHLKKISNR